MYGRHSSALSTIKWSSMLMLIFGLMIFIFTIVLFALEFNEIKAAPTLSVYLVGVLPGFILSFMAIGAGVAGSTTGKYEGMIHNISAKNVVLALSVGTLFAAMTYMSLAGTHYIHKESQTPLSASTTTSAFKAIFGIAITLFIFAFFCLVLSIVLTAVSAFWIPRESGPSPYSSERNMIVSEEKVPYQPRYGKRYQSRY